MRVVVGVILILRAATRSPGDPSIQLTVLSVLTVGAGLFLMAGLWTPIVGTMLAVLELWNVFSWPENLEICILLGAMGATLSMVGPGAWSIDARLFGRKHIDF